MELNDDGGIEMNDKTETHDFVVIKANFSGQSILWTPDTFERLEKFLMHSYDSKLYDTFYRLSDSAQASIFAHSSEEEVIVYVPRNSKIPIEKIIPIHVRNINT